MLDNARDNRPRELRAWLDPPRGRLRRVYLPSYAPNLNLIERFWHVMKRKVLFNRAYAQCALFKQAFDDFFERLHEHEAALARLITDRFHLIGQPEAGIPSA